MYIVLHHQVATGEKDAPTIYKSQERAIKAAQEHLKTWNKYQPIVTEFRGKACIVRYEAHTDLFHDLGVLEVVTVDVKA